MSGARHTQGPWAFSYERDSSVVGNILVVKDSLGFPTAFVPAWDGTQPSDINAAPEAKANACLIAAAPELLAALRGLLPKGWGDGTMDHVPGVAAAHAAIAKALGQAGAA